MASSDFAQSDSEETPNRFGTEEIHIFAICDTAGHFSLRTAEPALEGAGPDCRTQVVRLAFHLPKLQAFTGDQPSDPAAFNVNFFKKFKTNNRRCSC